MVILAVICAYLSAFLGGYVNISGKRMSKGKIMLSNGFSAGLLISIAIAHILPEADIKENYPYVLLGIGVFYLIQGYIRTNSCGDVSCELHESTGMIAWTGISFHALVDGLALGVSFKVSDTLGFLVMIAILIHKAPIGFSLSAILVSRGYTVGRVRNLLLIFSAFTPVGALASYFFLNRANESLLNTALAFSGGTLLHIYASELLPDVHSKKDRKVMYYVLLGVIAGVIPKFLLPSI